MGSNGDELPDGEVGELVASGENVTPGYLGEPDETAAILHDGWLWTGDLAYRDADGYFFHRGRTKEILKIGGHRSSPIEIEEVVARHPDVDEAAVIGVPDRPVGRGARCVRRDPARCHAIGSRAAQVLSGTAAAFAIPRRVRRRARASAERGRQADALELRVRIRARNAVGRYHAPDRGEPRRRLASRDSSSRRDDR